MKNEIWVIRDGEWIQYERLGECLACGDCCAKFNYAFKRTTVSIMDPNGNEHDCVDNDKDISKWNNWAIEDWDDNGKWTWWGPCDITPLDKPPCHLFDPATNHCSEFGKEGWKEICRKFPFRPEDLDGLDNCGFSFKETK